MPCPVFSQKGCGPAKPQAPRSTSEAEPPVLLGASSVTELERDVEFDETIVVVVFEPNFFK